MNRLYRNTVAEAVFYFARKMGAMGAESEA